MIINEGERLLQNLAHNGVDWWWHIEPKSSQLILQLAQNISYPAGYLTSQLAVELVEPKPFSTIDAKVFSHVSEILSNAKFDEESRFRLAVSATVATQYMKPIAARSWFFKLSEVQLTSVKQFTLVTLNAKQQGRYMVLGTEQDTATLMATDHEHVINDVKCIKRGQVIRVHLDRISPVRQKQ